MPPEALRIAVVLGGDLVGDEDGDLKSRRR
jgi:hypothetical protein